MRSILVALLLGCIIIFTACLTENEVNTYVYGLDLISATDSAGVQSYSLNDGLGSTADLTDGSGNVTASYGYGVFGATRSQSGTGVTAA